MRTQIKLQLAMGLRSQSGLMCLRSSSVSASVMFGALRRSFQDGRCATGKPDVLTLFERKRVSCLELFQPSSAMFSLIPQPGLWEWASFLGTELNYPHEFKPSSGTRHGGQLSSGGRGCRRTRRAANAVALKSNRPRRHGDPKLSPGRKQLAQWMCKAIESSNSRKPAHSHKPVLE